MGYKGDEIGITAFSVQAAVRKLIEEHDYVRNGPLVSLKSCAYEMQQNQLDDKKRISLLGNSIVVTMLEILKWNDQRLFPPIVDDRSDG
jgi:hypothetical protein